MGTSFDLQQYHLAVHCEFITLHHVFPQTNRDPESGLALLIPEFLRFPASEAPGLCYKP